MRTRRIGIFAPMDERLTHGLTIVLLGSALYEIFAHSNVFTGTHVQSQFITSVLFLDFVHGIFTFTAIGSLPELRTWAVTEGGGRASHFWFKTVVAALLFMVLIAATSPFSWLWRWDRSVAFPENGLVLQAVMWIAIVLTTFWSKLHVIAQMKGLNLLYNHQIQKRIEFSAVQRQRAILVEKLDKPLFALFMITLCTYLASIWPLSIQERALGAFFPPADWLSIATGVCNWSRWGSFGLAAAIVLNNLFFPRVWSSGKIFYLVRIFSIPFFMCGFGFGAMIPAMFHGTEYLSVTRTLYKNSSASRGPKAWRPYLVWGLMALVMVGIWTMTESGASTVLFTIVMPIRFGIVYAHFFTDRYLFRMRRPHTREIVSPLLSVRSIAADSVIVAPTLINAQNAA